MKKIILISAAAFLFFSGILLGEEAENPPERQLGIGGTSATGAGIYYQFIFNQDYRLQLAGLFLYDDGKDDEMYRSANGGFEIQKTIHATKYTRLYGLAGAAYWYEKNRTPEYKDPLDSEKVTGFDKFLDKKITAGLGIGIEFLILGHVAVNVDLLYCYENYISAVYKSVGFGGGAGLGYAF